MTTMAVDPLAEPLRTRTPVLPTKPVADRLDIRLTTQNGTLTAHLVGDLDGESAAVVVRKAAELAARGQLELVVELRRLFSVDIAGLATLRDASEIMNQHGGWLALVGLRPRVRHFLERSGTMDQFAVYKSVDEAARAEAAKAAGASAATSAGASAGAAAGASAAIPGGPSVHAVIRQVAAIRRR